MDLEETRSLLAVINNGSFKAAAAAVKQPRATLRRRVESLEARAGVALLERSRSGVVPTPAGELLARQGRTMLRESDALFNALRELEDEPTGDVRVGISARLPAHMLAQLSARFQAELPGLRLHLRVCDEPLTELAEHVDIAVLCDQQNDPTGHWRSRPLLRVGERLEASRAYLQRHGIPRSIDDLEHHRLLGSPGSGATPLRWPLHAGGSVAVEPTLTTNEVGLLRQFTALDMGIALVPNIALPTAAPDDTDLVPVLEGIVGRSHELRAFVPECMAEIPKIKASLAQLERFAASLCAQVPARASVVNVGAGLQGLHQRAQGTSM